MLIARIDATWILVCTCIFAVALIYHMNKPLCNIDMIAGASLSGAITGFIILFLFLIWS